MSTTIKNVKTIDFSKLLVTRSVSNRDDSASQVVNVELTAKELSWPSFDAKVDDSDHVVAVKFLRTKGDYVVFAPVDGQSNTLYRIHAPELVAEFLNYDNVVKAVVFRDHSLGYLNPAGTEVYPWASKPGYGKVNGHTDLFMVSDETDIRLATVDDFKAYNIMHNANFLVSDCFEPWIA